MRKLATIRKISDIKPIPNADRIEVAQIDGWEVVVAKSEGYKVGDTVVYIEIDSKMPEKPEYEFLKSRKYVVRTIQMRGQISQGLILPLAVLPEEDYKLGQDVTDILGITKFDPEAEKENEIIEQSKKNTKNSIIKKLLRFAWFRKIYLKPNTKTDFPSWISKTDEERIQNRTKLFEKMKADGTILSVTEKVDGCSATYFLKRIKKNKFEFGVCSRNRRLQRPDNSYYWKIAKQLKINDALLDIIKDNDQVVLQGEILGEGIQGNKYKISGHTFKAYNLIIDGIKHTTDEIRNILSPYNIDTVDVITNNYKVCGEIADVVEYVKGKSKLYDTEREGCVFRSIIENISFKCINPNFLLKEQALGV